MSPKTIAIVAYLTLIGWIIAFVMNSSNKSEFASFHIRQSLGITLLFVAGRIVDILPLIGNIASLAAYIMGVVFLVLGILSAINEEEKPVPFLGEHFQQWFRSI